MSENLIQYSQNEHIVHIVLNRPDALNSMNRALLEQLQAAILKFEQDKNAWVAILSGSGRAFCVGADLKEALELVEGNPSNFFKLPEQGVKTVNAIANCAKPIIAAVHGHCVAGGLLLANACALIVAAESTKFGMPETNVGMPTLGYFDLWKFIGPRRLMEISLTGNNFSAPRAYEMGLVNQVVADDQVINEAQKLAERITQNSPLSVQGHLEAIRFSVKYDKEVLEDLTHKIWDKVVYSEDLQEGLASFKEKRKPQWKGR